MQFPQIEPPDNTTLCFIAFTNESLSSAETRYRDVEREALVILHSLEKFCHYCFDCEVSLIRDYKKLWLYLRKVLQPCQRDYSRSFYAYTKTKYVSYTS